MFSGLVSGDRPVTLCVDDIKFLRPVEIGALLMMSSRVRSALASHTSKTLDYDF